MPRVPEAVRPPQAIPARADLGEWARLRAYVAVTDSDWVWCGALSDDGYGRFHAPVGYLALNQTTPIVRPSRWMWQAHYGPIKAEQLVLHACDRSWCARPDCLRLGDQLDNSADMLSRDRLTHPGRVGKADRRGTSAAARAVRTAVLDALQDGVHDPVALGAVVRSALAAGDPFAGHGTLVDVDDSGRRLLADGLVQPALAAPVQGELF